MPSNAINGNVDVIEFDNCRIGAVRAFVINGLAQKAYGLYIRNSIIGRIDGQVIFVDKHNFNESTTK